MNGWKRRSCGAIFLLAWLELCFPRIGPAQDQKAAEVDPNAAFEGRSVNKVEIAVQPSEDTDKLRGLIRQEQGKPFSMDAIKASVAALRETGKFKTVQVSIQFTPDGLRVLFLLPPVYKTGLITFPGAWKSAPYTQMLQAVNIPLDAPFVKDELSDKEDALRKYFATQGFFAASVSASTTVDDSHHLVNIAFDCDMGLRAKVGEVNIEGVTPAEAADIHHTLTSLSAKISFTSLKPGVVYSQTRIDKSLDRLRAHFRKLGRLAPNVRMKPNYDSETNRVNVALTIDPGPTVAIKVEGARIWRRTLEKLIPVYQENSVDQDLIDEGQRNLVSYFQAKSFFDVEVHSDVTKEADHVNIVYRVNKGGKHKVTGVSFSGNKYFTAEQLQSHIVIRRAKLILNRGKYSQDLLKRSAASITTMYRNAGFAKATVTPVVTDHEPDIDIAFQIDEGIQAKVHSFAILNPSNEPAELKGKKNGDLQLGAGKPFSPHLLEGDRNQILAWYLNHGYPNVQFDSKVTAVDGDTNVVDVVYKIDEGRGEKVGEVLLLGADHTKPKFIRSITDKNVESGEPLSQQKLLKSESDLYSVGVFDWASVAPVSATTDDQGQQIVVIRVHESRRNSMDIGGGLEIIPRNGNIPVGAVVVPGLPPVSLGNKFSVSQKSFIGPRGTFQFTRHNIRGKAETATLGLVASRLDQRLSLTYADPYLHGSLWSSLFSISTERTTENPIYTALLQQASFQIERQLDKKHTQKLVAGYSYSRTDLSKILIPELVLPQDQRVKLSTVYTQYIRDTRDNPLDAHRGWYQTFNFGVTPTSFGSSSSFVRFLGQTSFYRPVKPWLTWANQFRLGLAAGFGDQGYVPLSERFFTGGPDSLRGFPINGAGPQRPVPVCANPNDSSTCTLISVPDGGRMLAIFNSEARFPIRLIDNLGGVIFYDGGNVYSAISANQFLNNYTNNIGFGFRYYTKVGPIRVDFGRNLNPVPGVKATQYFVTLGQSF
ncbi:MAG: BamA/TamA family outer membrane protein [Acidobacteria bacterium]|nr:BamA/TamA family outer membrane protein [Acidobacteriota bacterium]